MLLNLQSSIWCISRAIAACVAAGLMTPNLYCQGGKDALAEEHAIELLEANGIEASRFSLSIKDAVISADIASAISTLEGLRAVTISGDHAAEIFLALPDLPRVESIIIYGNVNRHVVKKAAAIRGLRLLRLHSSELNDSDIALFVDLKQLKSLELRNTRITVEGRAKLQRLLPKVAVSFDLKQRM
jgi:hypothetical protein